MPARIARGPTTSNYRYVCLSCSLQSSTLSRGQISRFQHTGLPPNDGRDSTQASVSKVGGNENDSVPSSRIGDMIRSFMLKQNENEKEIKSDSANETQGKFERTSPVIASTALTKPHPKAHSDVVQEKLQHKFAIKRRQDILAMQVSQPPMAADAFQGTPVSIIQGPKKLALQAERKRERGLQKAVARREKALKRSNKRSKRTEAKPIKPAQKEVVSIARSTQTGGEGESPTSIITSAAKSQKTPGPQGTDLNETDSTKKLLSEQRTTLQKIDDINDLVDPLKKPKRRGSPAKKSNGKEASIKNAVLKILDELVSKGESPDINSRKAYATIRHYSSQLGESLTTSSGEALGPLAQSKLRTILHNRLGKIENSPTITIVENNQPSLSTPINVRKIASTERVRRPSVDSESAKLSPSKWIENARVPVKKTLLKDAQVTKTPPKTPIEKINASDLEILPMTVDQPPVPRLAYGLDRVLFNPGVYELQDPRSRVYNFDPYLQKIMPVTEFDFNALKEYITSSKDDSLNRIAREHGKRYMGSTSSMSGILAHFHFLLSQWRPINTSMLSKGFPADLKSFTEFQRIPSAIFLRWKDGSYAIDADKEFASANVLSMLGKSMEKLLTLRTDDFERYRKSNPDRVTEEERSAPESYHYSTMGNFLMRSQLDAHDPRLPGTGMFDLKTRSVVSIRMDIANYKHGVGYEITSRQGKWESYEREYYDLIRAAFLKYSMQVRMGRMDGIFVAFHNIERIFGFQYISLPEMDSALHGQWDTSIGDQEFRLSLDLLNKVLDRATKKYPESSLRIFFETRDTQTPFMYIFVEPVTEEQVAAVQSQNDAKIQEFERNVLGLIRGNGSGTDDAQEVDPKWEEIQADVQKAMERDEHSDDGPDQNREANNEVVDGIGSAIDRPELSVQHPSYANESAISADDHATTALAGNEDDAYSEDEDDIDKEEEEEEKEHEYTDATVSGDVAESGRQEGFEEFPQSKADVNTMDTAEAEQEVGGDGAVDAALSEDYPVSDQYDANSLAREHNEGGTLEGTFEQEILTASKDTMNENKGTKMLPNTESYSFAEGEVEDQEKYQTQADQSFLDSIYQEASEVEDDAVKSSTTGDILAMTLTLRNKVNGNFVLRPEKMTASDEWSIEYSLTEVSDQTRARALYKACQRRRSKKEESSGVSEDAETVNTFIQNLRELSAKGRRWREQQNVRDKEEPVQVL